MFKKPKRENIYIAGRKGQQYYDLTYILERHKNFNVIERPERKITDEFLRSYEIDYVMESTLFNIDKASIFIMLFDEETPESLFEFGYAMALKRHKTGIFSQDNKIIIGYTKLGYKGKLIGATDMLIASNKSFATLEEDIHNLRKVRNMLRAYEG